MANQRDALKAGEIDRLGRKVLRVFARGEGYVIYETVEHCVACDADDEVLNQQVSDSYMRIAELTTHHKSLKAYNSNLAHALKVAFDGDPEAASKLLDRIYRGMKDCLKRWATQYYQIGALAFAVIPLIVLWPINYFVTNETALRLYYSLTVSSLGGFASVYIGSSRLGLEPLDGRWTIMFNGALRTVVAAIFGCIVYFLVQADVVLSFLKNTGSPYGYLVAAFAAGFSERLVPNAIEKIESAEYRHDGREVGARAVDRQQAAGEVTRGRLVAGKTSTVPEIIETCDTPTRAG